MGVKQKLRAAEGRERDGAPRPDTLSLAEMRQHVIAGRGGIIHNGRVIASINDLPSEVEVATANPAARAQLLAQARYDAEEAARRIQELEALADTETGAAPTREALNKELSEYLDLERELTPEEQARTFELMKALNFAVPESVANPQSANRTAQRKEAESIATGPITEREIAPKFRRDPDNPGQLLPNVAQGAQETAGEPVTALEGKVSPPPRPTRLRPNPEPEPDQA